MATGTRSDEAALVVDVLNGGTLALLNAYLKKGWYVKHVHQMGAFGGGESKPGNAAVLVIVGWSKENKAEPQYP